LGKQESKMQTSSAATDFEKDLQRLKARLGDLGSENAAYLEDVKQILGRFDAGQIIGTVDSLALPAGAPLNIALYRSWLDVTGGRSASAFAIWFNLGVQYTGSSDFTDRITCYKNALALKPDFYQAAVNLGLAYEQSGEPERAIATWQASLQSDDARTTLLNHTGRLQENVKKLDLADATLTASLLTKPKQPDVLHHIVGLRTKTCSWPLYRASIPGVTYEDMVASTRALTVMAVFDDTAHQNKANLSWIEEKMPPAPIALCTGETYGHDRLRIGYLSSDFCMHPISYLVAELFERHDRKKFEIYGYCSTKDDGSEVRQRILNAFDVYVDIRKMTDEEAARRIRADEIDVLIDLNGLTLGTRLQALRWRPAPVQMTYLGYNGPIPLPELDYIISDRFVIPPAAAETYRPRPFYMPSCFQVNDSNLPIAPPETRESVGLPDDKFVLCSFSNTYKVTETVFDGWMEILVKASDAVLWLFVDNPYAQANLSARAIEAGVARERIIFAGRVDSAIYRSRLALADLFLDTYPYNSGTTASDALRVGLPLITLSGESFTARMAGSLLSAMGLDDGIVYDQESYVALAVRLATDKERYARFRQNVTPERWHETLGNTPAFCRDLEAELQKLIAPLANAA
jgi:predicted O-linked N-acetylglucosamine transferase (SPINDLY family)